MSTEIRSRYWRIMDRLSDAMLENKQTRVHRLEYLAQWEAREYREAKAKEPSELFKAFAGMWDPLANFPTIRKTTNL